MAKVVKMTRARHFWMELRASLWFVPALIVIAAVILAAALIETDSAVSGEQLTRMLPRLFGAGADGSRALLSAIASSMITVAGVTFSITVVALALASSQYSSRILRNFMQDRANQAVLGVFLGIFAYCIIVLRTIRGGDEGAFVPPLAVFGAVLLAFVAIGFLIYFIHHIAVAIQATSIVGSAAVETMAAVERLFPTDVGGGATGDSIEELDLSSYEWRPVPALASGYVQLSDADAVFQVASSRQIIVSLERRIGEFVVEGSPLASVTSDADQDLIREVNDAFTVGRHRTVHQDAAYGIQQIVDVALKALSPGINDTTTAVTCVDFLGMILARVASRRVETPYRFEVAELRVIARGPNFPELLKTAFDPIRWNADANVAVLVRMLGVLGTVAERTTDRRRRQALLEQADLIVEAAERNIREAYGRGCVVQARRLVPAVMA